MILEKGSIYTDSTFLYKSNKCFNLIFVLICDIDLTTLYSYHKKKVVHIYANNKDKDKHSKRRSRTTPILARYLTFIENKSSVYIEFLIS